MQTIRLAFTLAFAANGAAGVAGAEYQRGIGAWNCQQFITAVAHTDTQVAAYSWAMGYVAGINTASIIDRQTYRDVSGADDVTVLAGMIAFCHDNPNQPVIAAVDALLPRMASAPWEGR